MKTIATLALIMALLGLPAVNATADTFTLWEYFPQFANGENGFGTAGVTHEPEVLDPLDYISPYNFSRDGVVVARSTTEPLILLKPSATETAVYFGVPPETVIINVSGQFDLVPGADSAYVTVGTADISDPIHPIYTALLNDGYGVNLYIGDPTVTFNFLNLELDPTHALVFAVDQGNDTTQVYLQGAITTVPVPAPLVLLGSGLLGLAGWRRRPWLR